MTRTTQKQSERCTLDGILAALALRPDAEPQQGETPDFLLRVDGRLIGVEITMYHSGATVDDGTERRPVEAEWERLEMAANVFRAEHADLQDVNIGLMFKGVVPPRREHASFLDEMAAFLRDHSGELSSEDRAYWLSDFRSSLMRKYLGALYLRTSPYAEWYSNLLGGYVAAPGLAIATIVAEKSNRRFRFADELWLAIQCGTRISETTLDIMGVEDFEAVPMLEPYVFERVFVLSYTGTYEWRRGAGWRSLTGESVIGQQGSSFDDQKKILSEPEWLGDPDGKAVHVVRECLHDLRKK